MGNEFDGRPKITARSDEFGWYTEDELTGNREDLFWSTEMSMQMVRTHLEMLYPNHNVIVHGNRPAHHYPAWMRGHI